MWDIAKDSSQVERLAIRVLAALWGCWRGELVGWHWDDSKASAVAERKAFPAWAGQLGCERAACWALCEECERVGG